MARRDPYNQKTSYTGKAYTPITLSDADLLRDDKQSNGSTVLVPHEGHKALYDSYSRKGISTVESATPLVDGFSRKGLDTQGNQYTTVYIDASQAQDVRNALAYARSNTFGRGQFSSVSDASQMGTFGGTERGLTLRRRIYGKENQATLKERANNLGFNIKELEKGVFELDYHAQEALLNSYEQEHTQYEALRKAGNLASWTGNKNARFSATSRIEKELLGDILSGSAKAYKQELKEAEDGRAEKVKLQNEKYGDTYTRKHERYSDLVKNKDNLTPDELLKEYKNIERKDKAEEQAEAKDREKKAQSRKVLGAVSKVIAEIAVVANIARRILTSVLDLATKSRQDAVIGHELGISLQDKRSYDLFDTAHGLKEGTTVGALQGIEKQFGDVTNLNERSLGILARVMGNSVTDMVNSGMGGKDPHKLLENILDKYFENYKNGKNSLGQYVGREQARRELTNGLSEVSPQIASLFAQMAEDFNTGRDAGKFSSYKGWQETTRTNTGGITDVDFTYLSALGREAGELKKKFTELKDTALNEFAKSLGSLVSKINDIRLGESTEEKVEHNKSNREKLAQSKREDISTQRYVENAVLTQIGKDARYQKFKGQSLDQLLLNGDFMSTALGDLDPSMLTNLAEWQVLKGRLLATEKELGKTTGNIKYNAIEYTQEGKNEAVQKKLDELRKSRTYSIQGQTYGLGGGLGASLANKSSESTIFSYDLIGNDLQRLESAYELYKQEYGDADNSMSLLVKDSKGNYTINPRLLKSRAFVSGNFNDPFLELVAEAYNHNETDTNKQFGMGGINGKGADIEDKTGLDKINAILKRASIAEAKRNNGETLSSDDLDTLNSLSKLNDASIFAFAKAITYSTKGRKYYNAFGDDSVAHQNALNAEGMSELSVIRSLGGYDEIKKVIESQFPDLIGKSYTAELSGKGDSEGRKINNRIEIILSDGNRKTPIEINQEERDFQKDFSYSQTLHFNGSVDLTKTANEGSSY